MLSFIVCHHIQDNKDGAVGRQVGTVQVVVGRTHESRITNDWRNHELHNHMNDAKKKT